MVCLHGKKNIQRALTHWTMDGPSSPASCITLWETGLSRWRGGTKYRGPWPGGCPG